MQIPKKDALGEMRPNEPGWNHRGRGRRSPQITEALMSTACTRMPGARAAAFADKAALKTAELIVTISPRHLNPCAKHRDVRSRHARRARRIWLIRDAARHGRHSEW